jgi:hypothetical protein
MFKYIASILLIGISVTIFVVFTNPIYNQITEQKKQQKDLNEALDNARNLEIERDKLTTKYNGIAPENLEKIKKLLPDNVDNIRLILEIESLASPYSMALKDVQYSPVVEDDKTDSPASSRIISGGGDDRGQAVKNYDSWDLAFSTTSTYSNFLNFTRSLENNLRIIDISSIQFTSVAGAATGSSSPEVYRFGFKIKTYWLKN